MTLKTSLPFLTEIKNRLKLVILGTFFSSMLCVFYKETFLFFVSSFVDQNKTHESRRRESWDGAYYGV